MLKDKTNQATIMLLLGVLFWGMTFAFIREAMQYTDAFSFISIRFFIASIILTVIFFNKLKDYSKEILKTGIFIGILLAASLTTQTIGLQYTTASNAGFITALHVVFVLIFVALLDKKLPSLYQIASVILAFIGLFLIVVNQDLSFNIGDIWVLMCAVTAALHLIAIGRLVKKIDAVLFSLTQFYTVAIITLILGLFINGEIVVAQNFTVWQAILFCSLFATVYMYTAQAQFQRYLTEVKTAIIFSFEPLFAALFAFIYLNEVLSNRLLFGGLLIFLAMVLSEWDLKNGKN